MTNFDNNGDLFKTTQEYVVSFVKAPITTLQNHDLDVKGSALLLAMLPFALFLAIWSLMNRLISTLITTISGAFGGLGALIMPNADNFHADAMSTINWGGMFFGTLLLVATWFALMMVVPVLLTKIFKITEKICLKQLFTQTTALTIPMTAMSLIATILGFVGLALWFLPMILAVIAPILLQLFVINKTWDLKSNKTFYFVLLTQLIIVIVVGLLLASLISGMGNSLMDGLFF